MALFDVNLAPLELGNVFCEAKSELKFIEAALADVPTVASPTEPYRRAIRDGENGYLARNPEEWYAALLRLVDDPALRLRVGRAAQRDVLRHYGPLRRADAMLSALPRLLGNNGAAAHAFALERYREKETRDICFCDAEIVLESDRLGDADVLL